MQIKNKVMQQVQEVQKKKSGAIKKYQESKINLNKIYDNRYKNYMNEKVKLKYDIVLCELNIG